VLALLATTLIAPADIVIENARIWSDGLPGFARFAAIDNGRFVYVGQTNNAYIGAKTKRINAQNRVVLPGLFDSHIHMLGGGLGLSQLQLREATSKEDFIARVKAYKEKLPKGRWILGGRYSTESWQKVEQPTKEWVDAVTGDTPMFIERMDGHSGLANSAALKLAGITKNTKDPAGGVIDRDANGEPTGILRETATSVVERVIPPPSQVEQREALLLAIKEANKHGITSVCDITSDDSFPIYESLKSMSLRFFLYASTNDWPRAIKNIRQFKSSKGWCEVRGLKAYMDGSLGSRTAYMHEPFSDNAPDKKDWRGLPMPGVTDGTYERNFKAAKAANLQPIVHAIGDEANHLLLDFVQRNGNIRARSEHAQHLLPSDIPRFTQLGVIASMQPYHKADDGRYAEQRIGIERSKSSYAFKSLLDAGAVVAFGSDWPVVTLNPFVGIEAAVTGRILPTAENGKLKTENRFWMTQENITVNEALRCYTSRAAYACKMENELGRIAPGYRADFVILNSSPFAAKVRWRELAPLETWVGGRRVYAK
jgi:predicted amidohydrolase YtcJ